jgi:hypothetical protein
MHCLPATRKDYTLIVWSAFLLCWAGLIWRLKMPQMGLQAHGPLIWIERLFLLLLYGYILLSAYGLGHLSLRLFKLPLLSKIEANLLAFLMGFGIFSLGLTIIGLIGWLTVLAILIWLAVAGLVAFQELSEFVRDRATGKDKPEHSPPRDLFETLLWTIILVCVPLQLISVASPVWDYDALFYHLEVPRQFLAAGRIYFNPEVWRSAYPFLGEMPFLVGIVFGLDSLGKLINLT